MQEWRFIVESSAVTVISYPIRVQNVYFTICFLVFSLSTLFDMDSIRNAVYYYAVDMAVTSWSTALLRSDSMTFIRKYDSIQRVQNSNNENCYYELVLLQIESNMVIKLFNSS